MWLQKLRRGLWSVVVGLGTILYLVEEWLWDTLQRTMQRLGQAPVLRQIEAWIARLPPAGAAVVFLLPTTLILPVKLMALHSIAHGHILRGSIVIIAAKLLATALFARIYVLTKPALMTLPWFVRLHGAFIHWRDWAYAQVEAHPVWRRIRASVAAWRAEFAAWRAQRRGGRRWRAWRRWLRMQRGRP